MVSPAGAVLLVEKVRKSGFDQAMSTALAPWRKSRAVHDPGKTVLDLALAVVLGGDCLADVAMLWAEPGVFGTVASDPTVSRLIDTLATGGSGEPLAAVLRPGNAGSNTAADRITATQLALAQLPKTYRRGRRTLIRTDSAGGTHEFVAWLAQRGRWLSYSVGMTITEQIHQAVLKIPALAWTPAVEPGGDIRHGAWVAEITGDVLTGWPRGMRLIVRKERPHPGAQLRVTDADGLG